MHKRIQPVIILLAVWVLFSVLPAMAQETTPDPQPTPEATEMVVVTPTDVVVTPPPPTETPTVVTPEITAEVTPQVTPTDEVEATPEVTDEPELTPEAEITEEPGVVVIPPEEGEEEEVFTTRRPIVENTNPQFPTTGDVTLIVGLNMQRTRTPGATSGTGTSALDQTYSQEAIQQAQEALSISMRQFNAHEITRYSVFPAMAMTVSQEGLAFLRTSNMVQYLQPVEYRTRGMNTSLDLIGVTTGGGNNLNIEETGLTEGGPGWVVAVIDGLPNYNHTFLQGRTEDPMCWTSGTGNPLPPGSIGGASCPFDRHGTHVAGTIAGGGNIVVGQNDAVSTTNLSSPYYVPPLTGPLSGVARGARIMPLGVFNGPNASDVDILAALQYVYTQRNNYPIAAVNMSLGGGAFGSACDAQYPAYYQIAAQLRSAGIAVIAASGNDYYSAAISAPACVSNIISVGAVADNDTIPLFSNYSANLDLLAPGVSIVSSGMQASTSLSPNNNYYVLMDGTSMASPHVAGAFALMRQASPTASVDTLLMLLKQYGTSVGDPQYTTLTWPRINVDYALGQVYRLNTPNIGTAVNYRSATFQWEAADLATWYELVIANSTGVVFQKWYELGVSPEISCNTTTCTVTSTDVSAVSGGNMQWYVRAYDGQNLIYNPYMGPQNYTITPLTTSTPTNIVTSPASGFMTYTWTGVSDATYYQIYVANSAGAEVVNEWVSAGNAGCGGGGTCTFTPSVPVLNGVNTWYVRAFKPTTYGAWSAGQAFTLNAQLAPAPTLNTPTSLNTTRPTLNFNATPSTGATYFEVYVAPLNNLGAPVMQQWVARPEACGSQSGTNCNVQLNVDLQVGVVYNYYVRTYNAAGIGAWSEPPLSFQLNIVPPPLPTALTDNGVARRGYNPTFTWEESNQTATYYELIVATQNWATVIHQQWYQRGNSIMECEDGAVDTCSVTLPLLLTNQQYVWGVRAYSPAGFSIGGEYNNGYAVNENSLNLSGSQFAAPHACDFYDDPAPCTTSNGDDLDGWTVYNIATINVDDPIFQWNDIENANYYELFINNSAGTVLHQVWYPRVDVCDDEGLCSKRPANLSLANGTYGFYVRAYGPAGLSVGGPFGNGYGGDSFRVLASSIAGEKPSNLQPHNTTIADPTPNLSWGEVTDGTWYRVYITNANTGALILDQWKYYTSENINCGSSGSTTTCTWQNAVNLPNGTYNWYVQGYNPSGQISGWSDSNNGITGDQPHTFTINVPAPDAATLTGPTNGAVDPDGTVTFTWNTAANATYYYLQIYPTGSSVNTYAQWLAPADVCSGNCFQTVTVPAGNYSWRVLTLGPGTVGVNYTPSAIRTFTVLE